MAIKKRTLIEKICDQAKMENSDLKGDKTRGHYIGKEWAKIGENKDFQPFFHKHIVSLSENPVSLKNFVNFDPDVRSTGGFYNIKYVPENNKWRVKDKPYVIGQDLVRIRVTVSGPKHWHMLAKDIPELGWLDRNGTLTDYMFGIAKAHPGMNFYFSVDWPRYDKMIRKKAAEMNIDIDNAPFVTYMTTEDKLAELNTTYLLAPERTKEDYKEEIAAFDKLKEEDVTYE